MKVHYDPKCEELAHWFLDDEDVEKRRPGDVEELAGAIQLAIESWTETRDMDLDSQDDDQGEDYSGQGEEK